MNPHVFFYIDVTDSRGKITTWKIESASPNFVVHQGWTKNALKPGDPVTVEGYMAKDEENFAKTSSIKFPDGRIVYTGYADDNGPTPQKQTGRRP